MRIVIALALMSSGCCEQAPECPEQAVVVYVTDGEPVNGVSIDGFACEQVDWATACLPETSIGDGDYPIVVNIEGRDPIEATLEVRTRRAPPFSCECEIPEGIVTIELEPVITGDAGI